MFVSVAALRTRQVGCAVLAARGAADKCIDERHRAADAG
jgi:hypothetical protein